MKFLHGYYPGFWEAYEKRNLITNDAGIRFCQSIDIDEKLKFNSLAEKNGYLFNLARELKCPFYIDRLQGGCFFEGYDYNMNLVSEYSEMLGENFLGFQMHEWMSNFVSDTEKLVRGKCPEPWTEKNITETIRKEYSFEHVFTESMSPSELAEAGHITDIRIYLETMEKLFVKRQKYTGGKIIPCDSAMLGFPLELKNGAEHIMAEIGHQTAYTSVQLAFARGMSKAYGRDFGAYYEPWGGEPFSACNYHEKSLNEWAIKEESFPFKTAGGNGGSSRSLQKRIMLYSLLSGAAFFSEEWGAFNTFYDCRDFELTPYGQTKLGFIRFSEKYRSIGAPVAPFAAVLPKEISFLDDIGRKNGDWYSFSAPEGEAERTASMREGLRFLFDGKGLFGNENGNLINKELPDAFDIVTEDVYDEKKYEYAINLTGRTEFEKKHRCISLNEVPEKIKAILPCTVEGGLHYMLNIDTDGGYFLTVFNNDGILRSVEKGEIMLKGAEKTVAVNTKYGRNLTMLDGDSSLAYSDGKYYITVPAGGYFFGKL